MNKCACNDRYEVSILCVRWFPSYTFIKTGKIKNRIGSPSGKIQWTGTGWLFAHHWNSWIRNIKTYFSLIPFWTWPIGLKTHFWPKIGFLSYFRQFWEYCNHFSDLNSKIDLTKLRFGRKLGLDFFFAFVVRRIFIKVSKCQRLQHTFGQNKGICFGLLLVHFYKISESFCTFEFLITSSTKKVSQEFV